MRSEAASTPAAPSGSSLAKPDPPAGSDGAAGEDSGDGASLLPLLQVVDTSRAVGDRVTRRWAWLPPAVWVAMTGLASDVDFLLSALQAEWDRHVATYEGSDNALSPLKVATVSLAEALYGAAQGAEEGRPYGVQCLVVGPIPAWRDAPSRGPPFGLFTLDPGGGYRHWGVATAIGRAADKVRRNVHELLTGAAAGQGPRRPGLPADAREALRVALGATMSALGDDGRVDSSAHYTALVLVHRGNGREPLMAIVDPLHVEATVRELAADMASKGRPDAEGRKE